LHSSTKAGAHGAIFRGRWFFSHAPYRSKVSRMRRICSRSSSSGFQGASRASAKARESSSFRVSVRCSVIVRWAAAWAWVITNRDMVWPSSAAAWASISCWLELRRARRRAFFVPCAPDFFGPCVGGHLTFFSAPVLMAVPFCHVLGYRSFVYSKCTPL